MAHLLRYAANQALFASVVGVALLLPTYLSSDGVKGYGGERPDGGSFSRSTIKNIFCRSRAEGRIVGGAGPRHDSVGGRSSVNFFPHCQNGSSEWRFVVVVSGAARTFKCCLASSPRRRHGPRRPFGSKSIWIMRRRRDRRRPGRLRVGLYVACAPRPRGHVATRGHVTPPAPRGRARERRAEVVLRRRGRRAAAAPVRRRPAKGVRGHVRAGLGPFRCGGGRAAARNSNSTRAPTSCEDRKD